MSCSFIAAAPAGAARARPGLRRWRSRCASFQRLPQVKWCGGLLGADAGAARKRFSAAGVVARFVLADYGLHPDEPSPVVSLRRHCLGYSSTISRNDRKRAVYREIFGLLNPWRGLRQHRACFLAHRRTGSLITRSSSTRSTAITPPEPGRRARLYYDRRQGRQTSGPSKSNAPGS